MVDLSPFSLFQLKGAAKNCLKIIFLPRYHYCLYTRRSLAYELDSVQSGTRGKEKKL